MTRGATYPPEERATAVSLYQQVGPAEASRQTGIPQRTILEWAKAEGVIAQANQERTAEARAVNAERVAVAWGDYREQEAAAAGATANFTRQALRRSVEAGESRAARELAVVYGILIDKAELLSGKATSRIEVWAESQMAVELEEMVNEVRAQRAAEGR